MTTLKRELTKHGLTWQNYKSNMELFNMYLADRVQEFSRRSNYFIQDSIKFAVFDLMEDISKREDQ
jgi:hypothetical protein